MNLTQLRYFYEVCRWQNISKAAISLHVSQPTISLSMQDLEEKTGLNLLRREGRRIEITEDGMALYRRILPILTNMDELEKTIRELSQSKNHIRIAVPLQIGATLLPALLGQFRREHPEISLEISESGGIDALRMVQNEELDLAITNYDTSYSSELEYLPVRQVEVCFATYPSHPLAGRASVTWEQIAAEPLVLLNGGFFVNALIDKAFTERNLHPHVLLYTPQLHTVKNLVWNRTASTVLTRQAILPRDDIVLVPLDPPSFITSGIVVKQGHQLYRDERTLIRFVKQNFSHA
jgi:LysR family transcriptional activator of glutamate synthase operon